MLPPDYLASRATFDALAARVNAERKRFVHACMEEGEPQLSTDVAYLGPADAKTLVVIASGTHGVEGYAGAACQFRFMETYPARYAHSGMAFLLVHAVNPWGFLHDRRVTREGVDLNRNFVDFPVADHPHFGYGAYHPVLVSNFRPMPLGAWNEMRLLALAATPRRRRRFQSAVTCGQYEHPDGLFFGGMEPTECRRVWENIVRSYSAGRDRAFLLDIHTGLGRHGAGELISYLPSTDARFAAMKKWFGGSIKSMSDGDSVSASVGGTLTEGFDRISPAESYAVGLEFGTSNAATVLYALRADQWYYTSAARLPENRKAWVRRKMKKAFAATDARWIECIEARFDEVMHQIVAGLDAET